MFEFWPEDGQYRAFHRWYQPDIYSDDYSFPTLCDATGIALTEYDSNTDVCLIFDGDGTEHLRDADPVLRAVVYGGKVYQIATQPIAMTDFQRDQLRRVQEGGE